MITWLFLFLGPLTSNVRRNVCNDIHAAYIQSTWSLVEAEFIIINKNNIKLFQFTISGDRKIFFTYISRICLDSAAVWNHRIIMDGLLTYRS